LSLIAGLIAAKRAGIDGKFLIQFLSVYKSFEQVAMMAERYSSIENTNL
jgi:transcriptional regulator NrdR family protein